DDPRARAAAEGARRHGVADELEAFDAQRDPVRDARRILGVEGDIGRPRTNARELEDPLDDVDAVYACGHGPVFVGDFDGAVGTGGARRAAATGTAVRSPVFVAVGSGSG